MDEKTMTKLHWVAQGTTFGYPKCCINHFIHNAAPTDEWAEYQKDNPLAGTGFVPCPVCKDKPVEVMVQIKTHRDTSLPPFPNDGD